MVIITFLHLLYGFKVQSILRCHFIIIIKFLF